MTLAATAGKIARTATSCGVALKFAIQREKLDAEKGNCP
jgi:hypothetical protein